MLAGALLVALLAVHVVRMVPELANHPAWHDGLELRTGPRTLPFRLAGGRAKLTPNSVLTLEPPPGTDSVEVRGRLGRAALASNVTMTLLDDRGTGNRLVVPVHPEMEGEAATLQWSRDGFVEGHAVATGELRSGDDVMLGLDLDGTAVLQGEVLQVGGPMMKKAHRLRITSTTPGLSLDTVTWLDAGGAVIETRRFGAGSPHNQRRTAGTVAKIVLGTVLLALLAVGQARYRGRLDLAVEGLTPLFPAGVLLLPGIVAPGVSPLVVGFDLVFGCVALWWFAHVLRPAPEPVPKWWLPALIFVFAAGASWGLSRVAAGGDGGDAFGGETTLITDVGRRWSHDTSSLNQRISLDVTARPGAVIELQLRYKDVAWRRPPLAAVLSFDEVIDSALLRDGVPLAVSPALGDRAGWRVPVEVTVAGERIEVFADGERILASTSAPPRRGTFAIQGIAGRARVDLLSYQRAPRAALGTAALVFRPLRVGAGAWLFALGLAWLLGRLLGGTRQVEVEAALRHGFFGVVVALAALDVVLVSTAITGDVSLLLTPSGWHGLTVAAVGVPSITVGVLAAARECDVPLRRVLTLALLPLIGAVALEGIGRFGDATHLWDPTWPSVAGETSLAWWFAPGGVPLSDNVVEDNAFRGRYVPVERPPGERRLALFGGSQAWGFGLGRGNEEHLYSRLLDHHLGGDWNVLNAAVNAGSSFNARQLLTGRVAQFDPELVVMVLGANDNRFYWGNEHEWESQARRRETRGWQALASSPLLSTIAGGSRVFSGFLGVKLRKLTPEDQVAAMVENVADAIRLCRNRSIDIFLVGEPTWTMIDEAHQERNLGLQRHDDLRSDFHVGLRELGAREGVPFETVHRALSNYHAEQLFIDSIHFTRRGHEEMAAALADVLYEATTSASPTSNE